MARDTRAETCERNPPREEYYAGSDGRREPRWEKRAKEAQMFLEEAYQRGLTREKRRDGRKQGAK